MIGPLGGPFHRFLQLASGNRCQCVFAIGKQLGAESAADVRADHPHLLDRDVENVLTENIAQPMAALTADGQRQMIAPGIVLANHRAGFHVVGDNARIDDGDFRHRMRLREGGLGCFFVADRCVEQNVAGVIRPDLRRTLLHRIDETNGGRQRRPLDLDRLDRVPRLLDGVSHNERNRVADMPHDVTRKDWIRRAGKGLIRQIEQAGKTAEILDVVGCENRSDARQPASLRHIDLELRVSVRRSQHKGMHRCRRGVIVCVTAFAANESIILFAKDALTDTEFDGSHEISDCNLERF